MSRVGEEEVSETLLQGDIFHIMEAYHFQFSLHLLVVYVASFVHRHHTESRYLKAPLNAFFRGALLPLVVLGWANDIPYTTNLLIWCECVDKRHHLHYCPALLMVNLYT